MTVLLEEGIVRAGLARDLPFVQTLGIRQDRTSYLVYSADGRERVAHVKVVSSRCGVDSLATEHVTLGRIARLPGLRGRVPAPRAWVEAGGTAVSVTSGMRGRSLDAVLARLRPMTPRRAGRYADAVVSWLDALHGWTRQGTRAIDPYRTADVLHDAGVGRDHVQWTYRTLSGHAGAMLPRATTHGDLWPGNVLVDGSGQVSVVDWETAEASGDPYDDLLFFLLTFVRATLPGGASLADAVTAGLLGGSSWRTALVRAHLHRALDRDGVPRELADPLVLRFVAHRAVQDAERSRRRLPSTREWSAALARYLDEVPA